jgi:CBS domain-containing protein
VDISDSNSGSVSLDDAVGKTVGDVMIARPKTWAADARVGEIRRAFERPSVRTVLLADGEHFVGAIERDGLPDDAPEDEPASAYAETQPLTATPEMPIPEAVKLLDGRSEPRLVVLDEDGLTLRGLLCLDNTGPGFCVR